MACALWLPLSTVLHPLMACYAAVALLLLLLAERRVWSSSFCLPCSHGCCAHRALSWSRQNRTPTLLIIARSSAGDLFLSSWRWFEYPGLLMPLLLLRALPALVTRPLPWPAVLLAITRRHRPRTGRSALVASICFVHRRGSLLLARLQVLRAFHFVYIAGVLLAGGMFVAGPPGATAQTRPRRALPGASAHHVCRQRLTYQASSHVESPRLAPQSLAAGLPVDSRRCPDGCDLRPG